jgi:hypothetical protein
MTEGLITVGGERASVVRLFVPNVGPWFADCDLADATALSGRVSAKLGDLALFGTIDPKADGVFGDRRKTRIVAGAGGWGTKLPAKPYHNDAGVRALTVAQDAAREAGETLGTFTPGAERVGNDYAREAVEASVALENVAGGAPWWVDYAGVTHVGPRPPVTPASGSYEVLEYDPRSRVVTLAVDDLRAVGIGSVLSERLDEPQTVRELEIVITDAGIRLHAWCGGLSGERGRMAMLFEAIVERILARKLYGKYRYRVVSVAIDGRLRLQAVRKAAGLPDILPISIAPGVANAETKPDLGTLAYVEFIEGDRALPIVTNFETSKASTLAEVSYKGAAVKILLPPAIFSGSINGAPATGMIVFSLNSAMGAIEVGSPALKVKP